MALILLMVIGLSETYKKHTKMLVIMMPASISDEKPMIGVIFKRGGHQQT